MHPFLHLFLCYFAPKLELDLIGGVRRLDGGAYILGGENIKKSRRQGGVEFTHLNY